MASSLMSAFLTQAPTEDEKSIRTIANNYFCMEATQQYTETDQTGCLPQLG